jgi:hypothetical protein
MLPMHATDPKGTIVVSMVPPYPSMMIRFPNPSMRSPGSDMAAPSGKGVGGWLGVGVGVPCPPVGVGVGVGVGEPEHVPIETRMDPKDVGSTNDP